MASLRWVIICVAIIGSSVAVMISKNSEIASLKAQLAFAQPKDDGAVVYVWPPVDPTREEVSLDRVTWTDEKGRDHVWACGEIVGNGRVSRYGRLVGINRVGWPIAEIANIIE